MARNALRSAALASALVVYSLPYPAAGEAGAVKTLDVWLLGSDKDAMDGSSTPYAEAIDDMGGGSRLIVSATCQDGGVDIDFEYHTRNEAHSDLAGGGSVVGIRYRLDHDSVKVANVKPGHRNEASINFAFPPVDTTPHQDDEGDSNKYPDPTRAESAALFSSLLPQDLRGFLHAHEARFEIPLNDRQPEVVSFNPQNTAFQRFVGKCSLDLKSADAEVAKQEAIKRDDAIRRGQRLGEARAAAIIKNHNDQRRLNAVQQACLSGGTTVQMLQANSFIDISRGQMVPVFIKTGELLRATATLPSSVAAGICDVVAVRDGVEHPGALATTMLAVPGIP